MMQGGDITNGDGTGGRAHPDFADARGKIPDELSPDFRHDKKGILSMANAGPNTGSSQFFITFVPTPHLDGYDAQGRLKPCGQPRVSCHAVFGEVTEGFEVLETVDRTAASESGTPRKPVTFVSAELLQCGPAGPRAKCPQQAPPPALTSGGNVPVGLITPGAWHVSNATDHILVWAENREKQPVELNWSLTFAEPREGWQVQFQDASQRVPPDGSSTTGGRGETVALDWAWTLMTLQVPEDTPAQTVTATLSNGHTSQEVAIEVTTPFVRVSRLDDRVEVSFEGTFADSGEEFYNGTFGGIVLGSGRLVTGADLGLVGLARGETQVLELPAPLAYNDRNPVSHARFDGKTLHFKVSITEFQ
jgi:cyclophilin family peptidyl-prolyl cis-trans isomerase